MPDRQHAGVVSAEFVHHVVQQLRGRKKPSSDPLADLLTAVDAQAADTAGTLHIASGVSALTGAGFVNVTWDDGGTQWDPATARSHALGVLAAADAATSDAAVAATLRRTGLDAQTVFGVINEIREARAAEVQR